MTTIDDVLILNTAKGMYSVDVDYDSIKITKSDKPELTNIEKIAKPTSTVSKAEFLAVKRKGATGLLAFYGEDKYIAEFTGLSGMNIRNIHGGTNNYYVFGDQGLSSIDSISAFPAQYNENLSSTQVDLLVQDNGYLTDNCIKTLESTYRYKMSDTVNIGMVPDKFYQYDENMSYIKTGNGLFSFSGGSVVRVKHNGVDVLDEYQNFKVVKTDDGLYFNNVQV